MFVRTRSDARLCRRLWNPKRIATPSLSTPAATAVGTATPLSIQASDPHGIRNVAVSIEQNDQHYSALAAKPPARHIFWQLHCVGPRLRLADHLRPLE